MCQIWEHYHELCHENGYIFITNRKSKIKNMKMVFAVCKHTVKSCRDGAADAAVRWTRVPFLCRVSFFTVCILFSLPCAKRYRVFSVLIHRASFFAMCQHTAKSGSPVVRCLKGTRRSTLWGMMPGQSPSILRARPRNHGHPWDWSPCSWRRNSCPAHQAAARVLCSCLLGPSCVRGSLERMRAVELIIRMPPACPRQ